MAVFELKLRLDPQDVRVTPTTAGVSISLPKLSRRRSEDYPNYSILYTGRELWL